MKYKSAIVRIPRNKEWSLEIPFLANYVFCKVVAPESAPPTIVMSLDGGDEIPFISSQMALDFEFRKLVVKVGQSQGEDIALFYLITGDKDGQSAKDELISQLEAKLKELEDLSAKEATPNQEGDINAV